MKKLLLTFLLAALYILPARAQINIGLMGGMNFSDARQNEFFFSKTNIESKLAIGGVIEYKFNDHFSLKAEPLYIEKGTISDQVEFDEFKAKMAFDLSYFELPLYVKYSVGNELKPYIFAGPSFGINLNSSIRAKVSGFEVSVGAEDAMNDFEVGLHLGGGLSYKIDEYVTIFMEAKYAFGLNDVITKGDVSLSFLDEKAYGEIPSGTKYFNRGYQIMLGFTFPLIGN